MTTRENVRVPLGVFSGMCCVLAAVGQVNINSDGRDGVFNPTTNTNMNMADHPDGIYQYQSVSIRPGVTVTFTPNANNSPVVWLVQSNCDIRGTIDVSGRNGAREVGGSGGPWGFRGGNGGWGSGSPGVGLGGGMLGGRAFSASYATVATLCGTNMTSGSEGVYGNPYLLPLVGGSGGGGTTNDATGGGGGGGAILIAASQSINLDGSITARGGDEAWAGFSGHCEGAGGGSGGAVRLVSTTITGSGVIDTTGGVGGHGSCCTGRGGLGRIRLDGLDLRFLGSTNGVFTRGFQSIIIPPPSNAVSLAIESVGGVAVAASPTGSLITPDVVIGGQQTNPVVIVVRCTNIPLNTQIIVEVKPVVAPAIQAAAPNDSGTQSSSTSTVRVMMPRGGGTIQAKAISGIAETQGASLSNGQKFRSYAQTGLTVGGERFTKVEVTATLGTASKVVYLTDSGTRYPLPTK